MLDGINQYSTPILTDNLETNYRFNGYVSKKLYRLNIKLNTNLSWFNYVQTLNNVTTINKRNGQDVGVEIKTAYKKWPDLSIGYTKGFSQFSGLTKSDYQSDEFYVDWEINFFKYWVYKLEYHHLRNTDNNKQSNYFETASTSLRHQKKNSPFGFEITFNNIFGIKAKNEYSFSDYMISQNRVYVMPRVFLFSVSYKL